MDNNLKKVNRMIFSSGEVNSLFLDESIEQEELCIVVQKNASLTIVQHYINNKSVILKLKFVLEENAQLFHKIFIKTDAVIKCFYQFILIGKGALLKSLGSIYLVEKGSCYLHVQQVHEASETISSLSFKTALAGQASYDYQGHITIVEKAFNAKAHQSDKVLLVNSGTTAVSIPSLKILCNVVQCGHASAIARINDDQLIMLANRGINKLEAKKLIINGFLELDKDDKW